MSNARAGRPTVSIVIPAYNAMATLGGTITGALSQTYDNVEVVVVDDGSTDRTPDLASTYGDAVRLVSRTNGGLAAARNSGAAAATGELLVFCDADDILLPPAVEAMVDCWIAAGRGRRVVTCNAYPLTGEGVNPRRSLALRAFPPPQDQRVALLRSNIALAISLVPAELWKELDGFDESLPVVEDWDFWVRAVYAGAEIHYQKTPHALWRWQASSLSSRADRMHHWEDQMFRRLATRLADRMTPQETEILAERLAQGSPFALRDRADQALRAGDLATARRLYRQSLERLPDDRKLRLRTWSMTAFPPAGHLWRRRVLGIERAMTRLTAPTGSDPAANPSSASGPALGAPAPDPIQEGHHVGR